MAVEVMEITDELEVALDLGAKFVAQLCAEARTKGVTQSCPNLARGETALIVHNSAQAAGRQEAAAIAGGHVQADIKLSVVTGSSGGGGGGRLCHHQAGAR